MHDETRDSVQRFKRQLRDNTLEADIKAIEQEIVEFQKEQLRRHNALLEKCAPHQRAVIEALFMEDKVRTQARDARHLADMLAQQATRTHDGNQIAKLVGEGNAAMDAAFKLKEAADGFHDLAAKSLPGY